MLEKTFVSWSFIAGQWQTGIPEEFVGDCFIGAGRGLVVFPVLGVCELQGGMGIGVWEEELFGGRLGVWNPD